MAEQQADVNPAKPALPGYWRFAWMLYMQPLVLHRVLQDCGVEKPDMPGWRLWRNRKQVTSTGYTGYLKRLLAILLVLLAVALLSWTVSYTVSATNLALSRSFHHVAYYLTVGLAIALATAATTGLAIGVAASVAASTTIGIAIGLTDSATLNIVMFGLAGGIGLGLGGALGAGIASGVAGSTALGVALCTVTSLTLGGMVGIASGVESGVAGGAGFGLGIMIGYFGLILYPIEVLLQSVLYSLRGNSPQRLLVWSPVFFHDLIYFPLPFLHRHIVAAAEHDSELAAHAILSCWATPGQRKSGSRALAELQSLELSTLAETRRFGEIVALEGNWLPGKDSDSPLLRALADTARFLQAAREAASPHTGLQHLDAAEKQLKGLENQLLQSDEDIARFLPNTLIRFRAVLQAMQADLRELASRQIPNPFVTGNPLRQDMPWGTALFRGREDTIAQVEGLLAIHDASASLALIGPRRCGKSSLLNMLKTMLPDTLVVLFDLQDNPADSPAAFYRALAEQATRQARDERRLQLPAWPEGQPIEALKAWLDSLEQFDGIPRILICIDEFERLEQLFPGQGRDLLQFMGLLRATIQHRRRVRLLVAGAAPFDELDGLWHDHFINLREIRIGYLPAPVAAGLLTRPIPEFPTGAIGAPVADEVFRRTGGQPFLTQCYGWHLVNRLNLAERNAAAIDDVAAVEPTVLEEATYYFNNLWSDTPSECRRVLEAVARGEAADGTPEARRWLQRRLMLDTDGRLLVPVFGQWIRERH